VRRTFVPSLVGVRGRFHQLYTIGHKIDCTKWKEDYNNCVAFQRSNSAADAVNCRTGFACHSPTNL